MGRARLLFRLGRVSPWLTLGSRHTVLFDRTQTIRANGTTTEWSARHRWSPQIGFGVVVGVTRQFGFDVGVDWHLTDVETTAVSLPGLHLGVQVGGGR